jgi:SET domain-containing protein
MACLCNHSCAPNATPRYRSWKGAAAVRVQATRDVLAGEEITMSYVDETAGVDARADALASYGFTCECEKCVEERAAIRKVPTLQFGGWTEEVD